MHYIYECSEHTKKESADQSCTQHRFILIFPPSAHSDRPDLQALAFFRPMSVKLQQVNRTSEKEADQWWVVQECSPVLTSSEHKCHSIEIVVFSDKVSPSSLGFLAGHGWVTGKL